MNEDIYRRADIYQLASFILCGSDSDGNCNNYEDVEKEAYNDLMKRLEKYVGTDFEKLEDIVLCVNKYNVIVNDLYFMNGMKVGAKILHQLLDHDT